MPLVCIALCSCVACMCRTCNMEQVGSKQVKILMFIVACIVALFLLLKYSHVTNYAVFKNAVTPVKSTSRYDWRNIAGFRSCNGTTCNGTSPACRIVDVEVQEKPGENGSCQQNPTAGIDSSNNPRAVTKQEYWKLMSVMSIVATSATSANISYFVSGGALLGNGRFVEWKNLVTISIDVNGNY